MPPRHALTTAEIEAFAHDVRAPLGGIEAMIAMLEASALDEGQHRVVQALRGSAAHLRQLCDSILGQTPELPSPTSWQPLGPVLSGLVSMADARARMKGLSFVVEGAEVAPLAGIEAAAFRRVLENLIDNAMRLTEAGGVTLRIRRLGGGRIGVAVSDTGPGLSIAEAGRVVQQGGKLPGRIGGAGIGLTLCRMLVEERGGTLHGGPNPDGRGALFHFDWPIREGGMKEGGPRARCLIVDDHPASRLVLKTILGAVAIEADEAAGVDEALALLAQHAYLAVFSDLRMPDGGGRALANRIHAAQGQAHVPLVIVSADRLEREDPLQKIIAGEILKPLNVQAVLAEVTRLGLCPAATA